MASPANKPALTGEQQDIRAYFGRMDARDTLRAMKANGRTFTVSPLPLRKIHELKRVRSTASLESDVEEELLVPQNPRP